MLCVSNDIFILSTDLITMWVDMEFGAKVTFSTFLKALIHCVLPVVRQLESEMPM